MCCDCAPWVICPLHTNYDDMATKVVTRSRSMRYQDRGMELREDLRVGDSGQEPKKQNAFLPY